MGLATFTPHVPFARRGGGVRNVVYENLSGTVGTAVELNLNYQKADPTNQTATPEMHGIVVRNLAVEATQQVQARIYLFFLPFVHLNGV